MTVPLSTDSTTTTTIMARHTQSPTHIVHKRRSSKDSDDLSMAHPSASPPSRNPPHGRTLNVANGQSHVVSRPTLQRPPGLSPLMTGVQTNGHSRARSISAYTPLSPSPLSVSFPANADSNSSKLFPPRIRTSSSAPAFEGPDATNDHPEQPFRRSHNRIHSRNLSIFFPRPAPLPSNSISELEDGSQEVSILVPPSLDRQSAYADENQNCDRLEKPLTPLGQGFRFGSKPPPSSTLGIEYSSTQTGQHTTTPSLTVTRTRRGHHHKHSLSHNFFSFLEPGSTSVTPSSPESNSTSSGNHNPERELHTQPVPVPVSSETKLYSAAQASYTGYSYDSVTDDTRPLIVSPRLAKILSMVNLSLGAMLWVRGQQAGSLACTGLGYWVVFDAIGLALSRSFASGLGSVASRLQGSGTDSNSTAIVKNRELIRRPYGAARLLTLLAFAQSVYLMFSAVYVCKETIEHVLLSAGDAEGHHHHAGDEAAGTGLELPLTVTTITLFSLLGSALLFDNNSEIVKITQTRIPPFPVLIQTLRLFLSRSNSQNDQGGSPPPRSRLLKALSNPFILSPLLFCVGILAIGNFVSSSHHRLTDLLLASLIAIITFNLAYGACVILGTVLLQTSPARSGVSKGSVKMGRNEGQMESFLRAMREVERHPHVVHLPAPHIWQITPGLSSSQKTSNLVVTLEIHVRPELGDEDVLELTRWAWERVVGALGGLSMKLEERKREGDGRERPLDGGPEVTVGIVRG